VEVRLGEKGVEEYLSFIFEVSNHSNHFLRTSSCPSMLISQFVRFVALLCAMRLAAVVLSLVVTPVVVSSVVVTVVLLTVAFK